MIARGQQNAPQTEARAVNTNYRPLKLRHPEKKDFLKERMCFWHIWHSQRGAPGSPSCAALQGTQRADECAHTLAGSTTEGRGRRLTTESQHHGRQKEIALSKSSQREEAGHVGNRRVTLWCMSQNKIYPEDYHGLFYSSSCAVWKYLATTFQIKTQLCVTVLNHSGSFLYN